MIMRCWSVAVGVGIELALRGMALAVDPRFPDWPCNQIKVPEISIAAVWAGPSIDDTQKAISDVITGTEAERQKKDQTIFAGLFKILNRERSEVMQGIERYSCKQKEFADQIRSTILQLRDLQDRPDPDRSRVDELTSRIEWDTRIFEERRKTISFVCEVPVVIEQRLFALARAIQQSLE
jgi:hypothetical protein